MTEAQAKTWEAFLRLPQEVRARILALDPKSIRSEECLSDEEVERMLAEAIAAPDAASG